MQKVLFSGLDCLPGQQDLFPTDGTHPADRQEDSSFHYTTPLGAYSTWEEAAEACESCDMIPELVIQWEAKR